MTIRSPWPVLAGLALFAAGCGGEAPGWIETREGPSPDALSEWGVYRGMDPAQPTDALVAYEPRHPLWSNGTRKHRALWLPEGARVDGSGDEWVFPEGTLFFKTFSADAGPIETRVIALGGDGWTFEVFRWNDEGTEATRVAIDAAEEVAITVDGEPATHAIPSRRQCITCHESAPAVWLGFGPYQRSAELADALGARLDGPASEPATVATGDPLSDEALRYFQGNCVHCHNGIPGPANAFDLRPEVALANLVDQPTAGSAAEAGIRVLPGDPEASVLFRSVAGLNELPMPPVGVSQRDDAAVAMLRRWIESLPE